jgi:hypothetical protein
MTRINPGMPKADVVRVLGKPAYESGREGVEVLHYRQNEAWWQHSDYFVRLVDGKVESYGSDKGRDLEGYSNPSPNK